MSLQDDALVETPRLTLRRWHAEDLPAMASIWADPLVMEFITDGRPRSLEESRGRLLDYEAHWKRHGFGSWAVDDRVTGALIGRIGFASRDDLAHPELGWLLSRLHWGRGFGREGASAALRYGFERLAFTQVSSTIRLENERSRRLAVGLGMKSGGEMRMSSGHTVEIYNIHSATWRAPPTPPENPGQ